MSYQVNLPGFYLKILAISFFFFYLILFWFVGSFWTWGFGWAGVGAGVDGRTENTTKATIIGCFHVLILKKTVDVTIFSFLIYIHPRGVFLSFGWVGSV
jgi:hypothetical protein